MHGMINRGLQTFVRDTYGPGKWEQVCIDADLSFNSFETMLRYDDAITDRVLEATAKMLRKSRNEVLEDFGNFVVSNERLGAIPRLMQFGGETFEEFLYSLEDIYDRVRIILPQMDVPKIELEPVDGNSFILHFDFLKSAYSAVLPGFLLAMADYYGALIWIEHLHGVGAPGEHDRFKITLLDSDWNLTAGLANSLEK
jgi:hypothetical protein